MDCLELAESITFVEEKPNITDHFLTPMSIKQTLLEQKFKLANQSVLKKNTCLGFSDMKSRALLGSSKSTKKPRSTSNMDSSSMLFNLEEESYRKDARQQIGFGTVDEEGYSESEFSPSYNIEIPGSSSEIYSIQNTSRKFNSPDKRDSSRLDQDSDYVLTSARGSRFEKKVIDRISTLSLMRRNSMSTYGRHVDEDLDDAEEQRYCKMCNLI